MSRNFFDPSPEQQDIVLIDALTLRKAEQIIDAAPYHNSQVVLSAYSAGRMELCPTQPRMINGNALCALRSVS